MGLTTNHVAGHSLVQNLYRISTTDCCSQNLDLGEGTLKGRYRPEAFSVNEHVMGLQSAAKLIRLITSILALSGFRDYPLEPHSRISNFFL